MALPDSDDSDHCSDIVNVTKNNTASTKSTNRTEEDVTPHSDKPIPVKKNYESCYHQTKDSSKLIENNACILQPIKPTNTSTTRVHGVISSSKSENDCVNIGCGKFAYDVEEVVFEKDKDVHCHTVCEKYSDFHYWILFTRQDPLHELTCFDTVMIADSTDQKSYNNSDDSSRKPPEVKNSQTTYPHRVVNRFGMIFVILVLFICVTNMDKKLRKRIRRRNRRKKVKYVSEFITTILLRNFLLNYFMSTAMKKIECKKDLFHAMKLCSNDVFDKWRHCLPPINNNIIAFPMHEDVKKFMEERGKTLENMMANEWVRLSTFATFPATSPVSTMRLSSAGFYYDATSGDEVICFKCGAKYKGWKSDDVPLLIHQRISPHCDFIKDKVPPLSGAVLGGATSQQASAESTANTEEGGAIGGASGGSSEDPAQRLAELNLSEQPETSNEARNESIRSFTESRVGRPEPALPVVGSGGGGTASPVSTAQPQSPSRQNQTHNFSLNTQTSSQQPSNATALPTSGSAPTSTSAGNRNTNSENITQTTPVTSAPGALNLQPLGIITARPRYPNFAVHAIRLQTFRNWPSHMNQRPEDLSKAGFFYEGKNDNVRCFFCGGGLRDWEPEDEPWIEHARWYQKCIYVRQSKGDDYVRSVISGQLELLKQQGQQTPTPEAPRRTDLMQIPAVMSVLEMGYPERLIKRAFKKCVSQYGGEANVSADKLLPMVWQLEEEPESEEENEPETISGSGNQATPVNPEPSPTHEHAPISEEELNRQVEEENRLLREQQLCKICMEEDVAIVFLPCGHMVTCVTCAAALRNCPICRTLIRGTVKAILS